METAKPHYTLTSIFMASLLGRYIICCQSQSLPFHSSIVPVAVFVSRVLLASWSVSWPWSSSTYWWPWPLSFIWPWAITVTVFIIFSPHFWRTRIRVMSVLSMSFWTLCLVLLVFFVLRSLKKKTCLVEHKWLL